MNDELIQDLKQFIEATTSQSEQRMMDRMDQMDQRFEQIDQRFEEIVDGMNQQTETILEHIDQSAAMTTTRLDDHEGRISRLERHAV